MKTILVCGAPAIYKNIFVIAYAATQDKKLRQVIIEQGEFLIIKHLLEMANSIVEVKYITQYEEIAPLNGKKYDAAFLAPSNSIFGDGHIDDSKDIFVKLAQMSKKTIVINSDFTADIDWLNQIKRKAGGKIQIYPWTYDGFPSVIDLVKHL